MASYHLGKRRRTEETITFDANKIDVWNALTQLDPSYTQQLLFRIAMSQPRVASEIWESYQSELRKQRTQVLNFGIHADEVELSIRKFYENAGSAKKLEQVEGIINQISKSISTIQEEATKANASFGTRNSGLETLRNIGEVICLSNSGIPHEVVAKFRDNPMLEDAMIAILTCMTLEERNRMAVFRHESSEFRVKLQDLIANAHQFSVFKKLGEVLDVLCGGLSDRSNGQVNHKAGMAHMWSEDVARPRQSDQNATYYASPQARFTGIAAMNQFTLDSQHHMPGRGTHPPLIKQRPAVQQHTPSATPLSQLYTSPATSQSRHQPQPQPRHPSPHASNAYYSAPPYQPALGNLAASQYSENFPHQSISPYQGNPRYAGTTHQPPVPQSQLASQVYATEQYWASKPSYQRPAQ